MEKVGKKKIECFVGTGTGDFGVISALDGVVDSEQVLNAMDKKRGRTGRRGRIGADSGGVLMELFKLKRHRMEERETRDEQTFRICDEFDIPRPLLGEKKPLPVVQIIPDIDVDLLANWW